MDKKILIVEDSHETVDLIDAILSEQGYSVIKAYNGKEGLEKLNNVSPHLIIADVLMPEMDGFMFFKELKKNDMTKAIPVIILTARAKMEDTFKAIGAEGFITKPIDANRLLSEVAKYLGKSRSSAGSTAKMQDDSIELMESQQAAPTKNGEISDVTDLQNIETDKTKVLLFGRDEKVLVSIDEKLKQEGCYVVIEKNIKRVSSAVDAFRPDFVLLELLLDLAIPIEEIVLTVNSILRQHSFEREDDSKIIMYKVEEDAQGVVSAGGEIADIESVLERCYDNGGVKYIGPYSSISFLLKIEKFIKKQ